MSQEVRKQAGREPEHELNENEALDDQLKQALLRRIEKETEKLETDLRRTFTPKQILRIVLQAVVTVIIALPTGWFFYKEIYIPYSDRENMELAVKNTKLTSEYAETQEGLDSLRQEVNTLLDSFEIVERKIRTANDSLNGVTAELAGRERELSSRIDAKQGRLASLNKQLRDRQIERNNFLQSYDELANQRDESLKKFLVRANIAAASYPQIKDPQHLTIEEVEQLARHFELFTKWKTNPQLQFDRQVVAYWHDRLKSEGTGEKHLIWEFFTRQVILRDAENSDKYLEKPSDLSFYAESLKGKIARNLILLLDKKHRGNAPNSTAEK